VQAAAAAAATKAMSPIAWRPFVALCISLTCAFQVAAQTGASASTSTPPITGNTTLPSATTTSASTATAPDVYLNVPTLSVGKIELVVEDLSGRKKA